MNIAASMLIIRRGYFNLRYIQLPIAHRYYSTKGPSGSSAPVHPRIAVVGSGPSGLYLTARLLQRLPQCQIDVFDKAQAPYGLIYYGVAPDHMDMKKSIHGFDRMFTDNRDRLELFCNVDANRDFTFNEMCQAYETVVLAYGASKARKMGLQNEDAPNCFSGKDFVSWYNGAPLFTPSPMLDHPNAVVIGNGNVAIDCSRILLSPPDRLAQTDITEAALRALSKSKVRRIRVLGRRGPKEISFTIKELRELLGLERVHTYCSIEDQLMEQLRHELAKMERPKRRLMELMLAYATPERRQRIEEIFRRTENESAPDDQQKLLQLQFHSRPTAIEVDDSRGGRVSAIRVQDTLTGREQTIPCGLLIYAIGFEHLLLDGVPRTEDGKHLKMLDWCQVPDERAAVYATGWCSHTARGLIADSQQQAYSVADRIADDWEHGKITMKEDAQSREQIAKSMSSRNVHYINWKDWHYVDQCEQKMGKLLGKTREKITDFTTMLKIMHNSQNSSCDS